MLRPKIAGNGPIRGELVKTDTREEKYGDGRTEYGEDANAKVVEGSEFLHIAFLELLFG